MVEIRKDYFTDKLSVVTSDRGTRSQFRSFSDHGAKCPFCPGNEEMTPQADLVLVKMGDTLVKQTDSEGDPVRGWVVRVFPDKFPIVTPNAAALLRRGPSLQRARDRLPLHHGGDAEARHGLPQDRHRPVDERPGDPPGQDALAVRSARRGLRRHLHQPGQGRGRDSRPPAHPDGHHPEAASRRRVGGGHRPELPQRAGNLPDVPGRGLRDAAARGRSSRPSSSSRSRLGRRPTPTSSGSTPSGTRRAC